MAGSRPILGFSISPAFRNRKRHFKTGAALIRRREDDVTTVKPGDPLDGGESDAGSLGSRGEEQVENTVSNGIGDTGPSVCDYKHGIPRVAMQLEVDRVTLVGVIHGIGEQLDDDLFQLPAIPVDGDRLRVYGLFDMESHPIELRPKFSHGHLYDAVEFDQLEGLGVGSSHAQKTGYAIAETLALVHDIAKPLLRIIVGPPEFERELGGASNGGERIANAVGNAGTEFADGGEPFAAFFLGTLALLNQGSFGLLEFATECKNAYEYENDRRDEISLVVKAPPEILLIGVEEMVSSMGIASKEKAEGTEGLMLLTIHLGHLRASAVQNGLIVLLIEGAPGHRTEILEYRLRRLNHLVDLLLENLNIQLALFHRLELRGHVGLGLIKSSLLNLVVFRCSSTEQVVTRSVELDNALLGSLEPTRLLLKAAGFFDHRLDAFEGLIVKM